MGKIHVVVDLEFRRCGGACTGTVMHWVECNVRVVSSIMSCRMMSSEWSY